MPEQSPSSGGLAEIRSLAEPRFEALLYRRSPWVELIFEAKEWWSNGDESLIATLGLDLIDNDWSWVILGRDETGVYRGVEVNTSLPSQNVARQNLHGRLAEQSAGHMKEFPQDDNDRKKHKILEPCVPAARLHPNFTYLTANPSYSPGRGLIKELSFAFKDRDGNYRKDFQTTGFDGRLWELYLYALFYEQKFRIDDAHPVPDFIGEKGGVRIAVEAVTVNPTPGVVPPQPQSKEEEFELSAGYMPIKWGSSLTSKLAKKYWEKSQVAGLPLVLAIHDYHGPGSMLWSLHSLSDYLFGLRNQPDGIDVAIKTHVYGAKTIPSGFFALLGAENISAVIASNEATLPKFNRMGKIAGFGDAAIKMRRVGVQLDLSSMSVGSFDVTTEVGVVSENWSSGTWVYHNPRAAVPLPFDVIGGAVNVYLRDGQRYSQSTRQHHVLRSVTRID